MRRRSFLALLGMAPAAAASIKAAQAEPRRDRVLEGEIIPPGHGDCAMKTIRSRDGAMVMDLEAGTLTFFTPIAGV